MSVTLTYLSDKPVISLKCQLNTVANDDKCLWRVKQTKQNFGKSNTATFCNLHHIHST